MNLSEAVDNKWFKFLLGTASIIAAVIALLEYQKKSRQYDLQNQKTQLDIEKANIELEELKTKHNLQQPDYGRI